MFRWFKWCCSGLVASLFLISPISAESTSQRAKIEIKEDIYNFGNIVEGASVSHDFSIVNGGTADLVIDRVVAGCGCTATALTSSTIKPGEEGKIRVTLDSRGMTGRLTKAVRIYSNDPDTSMSVVSLSGDVVPEIRIEPANLFFDRYVKSTDKSGPSQEVSIRINPASNIKIQNIKSFSKFIRIQENVINQHERKVTISLDPSIPIGEFRDRVILNLEGGERRSVNIPVFVNVKGPVSVEPSAVSFGVMMGDKVLVKRIKVESLNRENFNIKGVQSSDPVVTTKVQPIQPGNSYWVEVSIDPKMASQDLRATLTINGDGILSEPILLNVYGVLPPKL